MKIPRILLAAGASGSGKTLITCGLLQALVNRGLKVASFKCGPDYIDPMFHSRVIGTRSRNLDTFFTDGDRTRYLLAKNASDCEIAVMEGVMGYYDGVGGITSRASAYDLASTTDTPVILIVNSRGMSVSLAAYVKGFLEYKKDSHICGVIFNQMSPMLYPRMKKLLEEELSVKVLGYVPKVEDCVIESRHLGLVLPEEIPELKSRLQKLSEVLEKTLDIDGILELAGGAPELAAPEPEMLIQKDTAFGYRTEEKVRIGVADDEAFCFFYADNLNLLEQMGAELVRFSPIHDRASGGSGRASFKRRLPGIKRGGVGRKSGNVHPDPGSYPGRNALSGRMRRIHVSSSGNGGYGRKAAQGLRGDPWKGLPDTEAEPVRLYHPYGKTGYRTW